MSHTSYQNPSLDSRPIDPPPYENNGPQSNPTRNSIYPSIHQPPGQNRDQMTVFPNSESIRVFISPSAIRLHLEYPLHFVIFHCVIVIILSVFQISTDILLMSDDHGFLPSLGGGIWSGLFLILTAFITLLTTNYRNSCMINTSIFLHLFALMLTFLIVIVPNTLIVLENSCSTDLKYCQWSVVFKLTAFQVASGFLTIFMCVIYSVLMFSKLIRSKNKPNPVTPRPTSGPVRPNNGYPEHQNPFANENRGIRNPNYQTI